MIWDIWSFERTLSNNFLSQLKKKEREKAEWWLPEVLGGGRSSGDGWWWWFNNVLTYKTVNVMLCIILPPFFKFKKFSKDNFYIFERKGSTEVKKSDRAMIQVFGDLVLTCSLTVNTHPETCVSVPLYKKWKSGIRRQSGTTRII